jgi:hypothetical protein
MRIAARAVRLLLLLLLRGLAIEHLLLLMLAVGVHNGNSGWGLWCL